MKIAFVTHYASLYGANRSLINLIDGLRSYDVEPFVVAPYEGEITSAMRERGIPVLIAHYQYWTWQRPAATGSSCYQRMRGWIAWRHQANRRLLATLLALPRVIRQLHAWKVEMVHSNSSVIPIGAMASGLLRLPHVWHLREFVDLHYGMSYDWGRLLTKRIIAGSDARIAVSRSVARYFELPGEKRRQHVVYNGVLSADKFDQTREAALQQPRKSGTFTFALVGQVHRSKGQQIAIKALAILQKQGACEVRLLLVGAGDTRYLEKLARKAGVSGQVEFWGHVEEPYRAYLLSDAVLMCSKSEAMGRVTVEAMSACRPVIGFNDAGTAELIEHEVTGLLYDGGYRELAQSMLRLMEDREWSVQLGLSGWQHARKYFNIEAYAAEMYKVFGNLRK
jgi:glycosyltransferase involved in cell wall biosynthesis